MNVVSLAFGKSNDIGYKICRIVIKLQDRNCCSYIYEHK